MQELKDLISLETKFRVKHRLFQKVSFVMSNPLQDSNTAPPEKKVSNATTVPIMHGGRTGLRHSISEPANEKLFMEAAVASAQSKNLIFHMKALKLSILKATICKDIKVEFTDAAMILQQTKCKK